MLFNYNDMYIIMKSYFLIFIQDRTFKLSWANMFCLFCFVWNKSECDRSAFLELLLSSLVSTLGIFSFEYILKNLIIWKVWSWISEFKYWLYHQTQTSYPYPLLILSWEKETIKIWDLIYLQYFQLYWQFWVFVCIPYHK